MHRHTRILRDIITLLALALALTGSALAAVSVVASSAGNFNITPGVAVTNQSIGSVVINADLTSYDVTLRDDNSGVLKSGANSMSYTVSYNGAAAVSLTTTPLSVETGATVVNGARALTIFVPANASVGIPAGVYTATITIELLAV